MFVLVSWWDCGIRHVQWRFYNTMPPAARYLSTPDLSCSSITKIRIVLVFSPAPFDIPERPEQTASHSRRLQTGPGRYPTFEHEHRAFVGQTCTLARSSSSRKPLSAADEILRSYTHEVLITCRVEVVPAGHGRYECVTGSYGQDSLC
jgi:hypothetical protein